MYLIALRVRNKDQADVTGVNVAYYRHGGGALPRTQEGKPDLPLISSKETGTLVSASNELPPGGNFIRSSLECAAPDDITESELLNYFAKYEAGLGSAANHGSVNGPSDVELAFSSEIPVGALKEEFAALKSRLLAHLQTTKSPTAKGAPFVAELTRDDDAFVLQWTLPAKQRLGQLKYPAGKSLRIAFDIADQWKASGLPGPLIAHALAALAGVDLHELVVRGGVRVIDGSATVWERLPG